MGVPKRKLPRIIKSLPKLGLFCQVVLKKLSQEEIDRWTKRAVSPESSSEEEDSSPNDDDIEEIKESFIARKKKRYSYFASSDEDEDEDSNLPEKRTRVQPKRTAKKNIPLITTDTEDDFSDIEYCASFPDEFYSYKNLSASNQNSNESTKNVGSFVNNSVDNSNELVCLSVNSSLEPVTQTTCSSNEFVNKLSSILNEKIELKAGFNHDEAYASHDSTQESNSLKNQSQCSNVEKYTNLGESKSDKINPTKKDYRNVKNQSLPSHLKHVQSVSYAQNNRPTNSEIIDVVVNEDEENVGKIRIRDLRSLGASDSFIREANLVPSRSVQPIPILPKPVRSNSNQRKVGDTVKYLYTNHMSSEVKGLISEIARQLKEKSFLTENFNTTLHKMQNEAKLKDSEVIVNTKLEEIVKCRQQCDGKVSVLFEKIILLFYSDLKSHRKLDLFVTLIYLGFLSILNVFIKITQNRYEKKCLFKNMVLIFTECLRNGNYDNEVILNLFMSNKFQVSCFQLIAHIEALQAKDNFFNSSSYEPVNSLHQEIMPIPVRNISFKMEDSKMVIAFSKALEEVETEKHSDTSAIRPKESAASTVGMRSDKNVTNSSMLTTLAAKSVIITRKSIETDIDACEQISASSSNQNAVKLSSISNPMKPASSSQEIPGPTGQNISSIASGQVLVPQNSINVSAPLLPAPHSTTAKKVVALPAGQMNKIYAATKQATSVIQTTASTVVFQSNSNASMPSQSTLSSDVRSPNPPIVINSSNTALLNKIRSLKPQNGKNSRIQIVRPIIQPAALKQTLKANYNNFIQNTSSNSNGCEPFRNSIISQPTNQITSTQSEPKKPPPSYSSIVVCSPTPSRVENSYSTLTPIATSSLRQILLSPTPTLTPKKTNEQVIPQQTSNLNNLQYNIPGNVKQVLSPHSNLTQPHAAIPNNLTYPVQNSTLIATQPSTRNPYTVYISEPHDSTNSGPEMQQYSVPQPLNVISNHPFSYNKSHCYGDQQTTSVVNYRNDAQCNNNIQSNQMIINISQPVINQSNPSQVLVNYQQPVAVNNCNSNQYYSVPKTTVHWMPPSSVYTSTNMMQPVNTQVQYQHFPPKQ